MDDTAIGFDMTAAGADVTVIVLNRTDGGPWQLVDQQDPTERDAAVQDLVRRLTENAPAPRPPLNPTWPEQVNEWTRKYTGPNAEPFVVDEEQLRAATVGFARLLRDGRLRHDHIAGVGPGAEHDQLFAAAQRRAATPTGKDPA